jgi:antitoxin VapB
MTEKARTRVFMSGRSQHVTIPRDFRFRSTMVSIRRDPKSGDVILSEVPDVDEIFAALDAAKIPADFLIGADRDRRPPEDRPTLNDLFDDDDADTQERV